MWQSTITCNISTAQCKDGTVKCEEKKWITKYNKSSIKCDVRIAQCEDETFKCKNGTVKCEKIKNKRTTKCHKKTVTCDIETVQCENKIIKCDVLIFWYSKLHTNKYHTQKGTVELPLNCYSLISSTSPSMICPKLDRRKAAYKTCKSESL